jgi:glycine/D-amino acid oxidase-like deaminating enzyme
MAVHLHNSIYEQGGATGSIWDTEGPRQAAATMRIEGSETCDVAVIGGGLVGLSAAYHLAKYHGASVVVLEAAQPGWGSTCRGLGYFGLSPFQLYNQLAAQGDAISPARFFVCEQRALARLEAIVSAEGIDLKRVGEGVLTLATSSQALDALEQSALQLGLAADTHVKRLDQEALGAAWLSAPRVTGALYTAIGGGVHPLQLALGLSAACQRLGVRMFNNTRAREVVERRTQLNIRYRGGMLTAGKVLVATHAFTRGRSIPEMANRFLHVLFHGMATRPLSDQELLANGFKRPFIARLEDRLMGPVTFRVTADRRVAMTATVSQQGDPQRAAEARARLRALFMAFAPGLRDVPITHGWRGLAARSERLIPMVAPLSDSQKFYYAGGMAEDSSNLAVYLGALAAELLGDNRTDLQEDITQNPLLLQRMPRMRWAGIKQRWLAHRIARAEPLLY